MYKDFSTLNSGDPPERFARYLMPWSKVYFSHMDEESGNNPCYLRINRPGHQPHERAMSVYFDYDSRFNIGGGTNLSQTASAKCLRGIPEQNRHSWVAGHLLSASFGGVGHQKNLTPLTRSANSLHETIERVVASNQRSLADYFNQPVVKRFTDVLVFMKYKVATDDKYGKYSCASRYLWCGVSYIYYKRYIPEHDNDRVVKQDEYWRQRYHKITLETANRIISQSRERISNRISQAIDLRPDKFKSLLPLPYTRIVI